MSGKLVVLHQIGCGPAIGLVQQGPRIAAFDITGRKLWEKLLGPGTIFGGFDLDRDGVADFGLAKTQKLEKSCGVSIVNRTWLEIYSGRTGNLITQTSPLEDICHTALNYASVRWASATAIPGNGVVAIAPQYFSTGWFIRQIYGSFKQESYLLPTTDAFTNLYHRADRSLSAKYGTRTNVISESHIQNGVIVSLGGRDRLVIFTTGRVLQYAIAPLSASQLIADRIFFGRPDVAGRNYGLVAADPRFGDRVAIVAGTSAQTVWQDMENGKVDADPWGGIERHVTVYSLKNNEVAQRFFGSAHDNQGRGKYQNRLVYPAHIFLPSKSGASHIAFNRFVDGRWIFHITKPGRADDSLRLSDLFVWDIRDLYGDGISEVIASPVAAGQAGPFGAYLPNWAIRIYSWDAGQRRLRFRQEIAGGIPWLAQAPVERGVNSSLGALYPILEGRENGQLVLYVRAHDGTLTAVPLDCQVTC
jgi:hypothetical protein